MGEVNIETRPVDRVGIAPSRTEAQRALLEHGPQGPDPDSDPSIEAPETVSPNPD
jgi:hypothetical protein